MNATNIWPGTQYAFKPNSGRSERFSLECSRIRVIRKRRPANDKTKRTLTQIDVEFLDRDTGEVIDYTPKWMDQSVVSKNADGTFTIRSYDVIEFWEQVDELYKHLVKKQREAEEERERLYAERRARMEREERERQERMERARIERAERVGKVQEFLTDIGVKPEWIQRIDVTSGYIQLSLSEVEQVMASKEKPLTMFERAMLAERTV